MRKLTESRKLRNNSQFKLPSDIRMLTIAGAVVSVVGLAVYGLSAI